jgi:hypothetical protein
VEHQAELFIDEVRRGAVRQHRARQTELRVTLRRQEVELTALLADEHVRAGDVRAAREVEADERDLARALLDVADVVGRVREEPQIIAERCLRLTRAEQCAEHRRRNNCRRTGGEPLREEVAAGYRLLVRLVPQRLVEAE